MRRETTLARVIVGLGTLVAALAPQTARAAETGFYVKLDAGANFIERASYDTGLGIGYPNRPGVIRDPGVTRPGELELEPGFRVDVAVGYEINRWAAVELGAGVLRNEVHSISIDTVVPNDAWYGAVPVLANLVVRYENRTHFVPYIGAGVGAAVSELSIWAEHDREVAFAYQAMAGVGYRLGEHAGIDVGGKFLGLGSADYEVHNVPFKLGDVHSYFAGASFWWRF